MRQYTYQLMELPSFPGGAAWAGLLGSSQGLRRLSLKPTPHQALEGLGPEVPTAIPSDTALASVANKLEEYCQGCAGSLENIALDLEDAPPFFRAAWEACRRIPAGETRSYSWLAAAAGNPLAVRAAGQAMARNRLALVIPCHRVIGSDGGLHGYGAGGLGVKARLLALEQGVLPG
jgi:O-6-methylguanine DNA methyltransferase